MAYHSYYTHEAERSDDGVSSGSLIGRLIGGYLWGRFGYRSEHALSAGWWLFRSIPPLRQQLDYFLRHLPSAAGSLLDVGCGNGTFLSRVIRAGWHAQGIEPDEAAAAIARLSGCEVTTATLDTFSSSHVFDAITMSHVIEHVPDPYAALRLAFDLMVDGGLLWLATPNAESLGRRRYGADWRGLEVPRHNVVFTARALRALLERAGYQDIRFHRRGRGARYILDQSKHAAERRGVLVRRLPAWWVDLLATFSPCAGEELVVTARKPA
ncbi:class I SAM-dependent methyltransferase [Luteibacter aegosomatis]|uniref:class I SAM-dependent methyltransferase n=1 Tax=Luteibacter aegosomatis TaxID=2911537 RepID=UPI001FFA4EEB|nr:class I SAM-dependent methyltransferase [Luteibacter aegosomatis]UPG84812.1 class I SAM-dependent methyltransferase [Luteibacter aegosomatis]